MTGWTRIEAYGQPRTTPPRPDCAWWISANVLAWYFPKARENGVVK